ncbi:MAG TPA: NAD(P)/FAD-dependent oxidoreductase, partial [Thermodesulfobacteriota bacterium]|nr:NAD(P)/FAD-dependent oxidoreductase [Thermodesulfobacteriota bacterium]
RGGEIRPDDPFGHEFRAEGFGLASHFHQKLRASESISEKVSSHPKIRLKLGRTVQEITGKEQVEGIRLSGEGEFIPLQGVFIFLQGSQPIIDYLLGQIGILEDGCIRVDGEMQTNVPGVFAVGDLLCRKIKQAVIAAAEGAVAAIAAEKYLRARGKARLDWR